MRSETAERRGAGTVASRSACARQPVQDATLTFGTEFMMPFGDQKWLLPAAVGERPKAGLLSARALAGRWAVLQRKRKERCVRQPLALGAPSRMFSKAAPELPWGPALGTTLAGTRPGALRPGMTICVTERETGKPVSRGRCHDSAAPC